MKKVIYEANNKLKASSHHFARTVQCEYADGVLKIHGKVPSYFLKQTAQSLIQGIDGVERVDNEIVVVNSGGMSGEPVAAAG